MLIEVEIGVSIMKYIFGMILIFLMIFSSVVLATDTNLMARWKFNEGQGRLTRGSPHEAHVGSLLGGATWTQDSHQGYALSLDGVNDYVRVEDHYALDMQAMVVKAWVKIDGPSNTGQVQQIVSKPGQYSFGIGNTLYPQHLVFTLSTGVVVDAGGSVPYGEWHHVTFDYNGTSVKSYLDNVLVGDYPVASGLSLPNTLNPLGIGGTPLPSGHAVDLFKGKIDNVKIYRYDGY